MFAVNLILKTYAKLNIFHNVFLNKYLEQIDKNYQQKLPQKKCLPYFLIKHLSLYQLHEFNASFLYLIKQLIKPM